MFVVVGFAVALGLIVFAVVGFLLHKPPTVAVSTSSSPGVVDMTLQTDGAVGVGPHPNWVGYFVKDASGGWKQTTVFQLPANSDIHVTVYEYDSGGSLRNNVWSQVQGTTGGVAYVNGNAESVVNPSSSTGNGIAHSFDVPGLGINVPLYGVAASAKNFCSSGPCNLSEAHTTVTFDFHTGAPGIFRWQCFIPCGLGYLNGNGGPMTTVGYMGGFLKVVG